jgi:hypothetical protein
LRIILKSVIASLSASLFVISNILLFGSFNIYQGNINEFVVPLTSILKIFLLPAFILILVLSAIGLLLPKKSHQRYISILFILGILIWLQGNILVWKYGLLDGHGIDWSKNVWRGWADLTLWVVLLFVALLFYKQIYKIAGFASIALLSLLSVSLVFTSIQKPEIWEVKEKFSLPTIPPEEIFEFSSKQNIIHFILDGFQSDIFQEIISEDIDHYSKSLQGFTFFKENIGSFPTTYMSIPAFFSGKIYKNNIPMRRFLKKVIGGRTITNVLHDLGYEIDFVAGKFFFKNARYSNLYRIAFPYGGTKQHIVKTNSALMLDLVLFRCAPHFLKRAIYNNEQWFVQRILASTNGSLRGRYFSHKAFLNDLINHMSVSRIKPVYKYIHLMTSHPPVVVNNECEYTENIQPTRENLKIQAKCCLDDFIKFLLKLKMKGVYESSLIILHADHGVGREIKMKNMSKHIDQDLSGVEESIPIIAGSAVALMAIKPPQSKGILKTSKAQTTLTDIPATISSILNLNEKFDGRSVFEIDPDEVRERNFYFYKWRHENWKSTYFHRLDEFTIKGSVFDRASWKLGLTYYPPKR